MTPRLKIKRGALYESAGGGLRIITMVTQTHVFYIVVKGRRRGTGSHCSRKVFRKWVYREVALCATPR